MVFLASPTHCSHKATAHVVVTPVVLKGLLLADAHEREKKVKLKIFGVLDNC